HHTVGDLSSEEPVFAETMRDAVAYVPAALVGHQRPQVERHVREPRVRPETLQEWVAEDGPQVPGHVHVPFPLVGEPAKGSEEPTYTLLDERDEDVDRGDPVSGQIPLDAALEGLPAVGREDWRLGDDLPQDIGREAVPIR